MKHFQAVGFLYILHLAVIVVSANGCINSADPKILPVEEGYKPDHAIDFSHEVHAKIDCKYCHNSENDGKEAGIPAANICMKCHKQIIGDSL